MQSTQLLTLRKLDATQIYVFSHLSIEHDLLTAATIIVQFTQLFIDIYSTFVSM